MKGKELYNFLFYCLPDFCAVSSHKMEERSISEVRLLMSLEAFRFLVPPVTLLKNALYRRSKNPNQKALALLQT